MSKKYVKKNSKRLSKFQLVKSIPSVTSYSSCKIVYKPSPGQKILKLTTPMAIFDNCNAGGFNSNQSKQGLWDDPFPMFQGTAINTLTASGLRVLDRTGSVSTAPNLQVGQRSFRILLERAYSETYFSNAGATSCELVIYDLVAKTTKAVGVTPATDWANGCTDEQLGIPNTFPAQHDPFSPFAEPTQVKRFNQNWTVVKKVVITLGVGRQHKHIFDFKPQRIVDTNYTAQYQVIRGITCGQIILARGQPADDTNGVIVGNVGIARVKIVGTNRIRYTHRVTSHMPRIYEVNNTILDGIGGLFVKEEDGDVINSVNNLLYA